LKPYVTAETLPLKTSAWLDTVAAHNRTSLQLERSRAALLVIDMQTFFMDPASPSFTCGGLAILPNVRGLIESFRSTDRPVIFTRHAHRPDGSDAGLMSWWWKGMCREGMPESEIVPELAPRAGEQVVVKRRYSAFYNTDLETVLRCQGIRDLAITGIMTNMCCETTARDAYMRDHRVFFPADGNGSVTEDMHVASLVNLAFGFAVIETCAGISEAVRS
jgi:nicotinamidase-related amidase